MITSTRSPLRSDPIRLFTFLNCLWFSGGSSVEIIAHDQTQNEPASSQRALHCPADLRFPDARVVADRDFCDAISGESALQDHFDGPAVGHLFKGERAYHFRANRSKGAEVGDPYAI